MNKKTSDWRVPFPFLLHWDITSSCTQGCIYCDSVLSVCDEPDFSETVDRVISFRPKMLWIGGGEPSMISSLPDIVKKIKTATSASVMVNTNLVYEKIILDTVPYLDSLVVSIDTADEEVNFKFRKSSPLKLIGSLKNISDLSLRSERKIEICVNSVVYPDSLSGQGLKHLNDKLFELDPDIGHLMCPVMPAGSKYSIINDEYNTKKFFDIFEELRQKGRKVQMEFAKPSDNNEGFTQEVICYRRYFRVYMSSTGPIIPVCPYAPMDNPVCREPCNCAGFLDEILKATGTKQVSHGFFDKKFSYEEFSDFIDFIKTYVNPEADEKNYKAFLQ